jgi:hypothetical protein
MHGKSNALTGTLAYRSSACGARLHRDGRFRPIGPHAHDPRKQDVRPVAAWINRRAGRHLDPALLVTKDAQSPKGGACQFKGTR